MTDPAPRLTAADEIRLAKRIERGDLGAKEAMIAANLGLVRLVAQRYRDRGVPYEDLVQEGVIGLVRAVEKFDHRRGLKFSTYAVWWIRRALLNAIHGEPAVHIPASAQRRIAAIMNAEDELRRHGGTASNDEIARRTGLSERRVHVLRALPTASVSLDAPVGDDGTPLRELVADSEAEPVWLQAETGDLRRRLRRAVGVLPARHREVVVRRYGLGRDEAQSHAEIAASLGIGTERSRQLEREALHWLRALGDRSLSAA
jgi:RNA polymerase primary sigma factor